MTFVTLEQRWLMDRAADAPVYVALVLPEWVGQVEQWNTSYPDWTYRELFAALQDLDDKRLIQFEANFTPSDEPVAVERPELNPQTLVRNYKQHSNILSYKLAPAGGVIWEQQARPDWSRTYIYAYSFEDAASREQPVECIVTASTQEVARRALLVVAETGNLLTVPGSERYEPCGEWQARYWKTIDQGVRAIALAAELEEGVRLHDLLTLATLRELGASCSYLHRWYERADHPTWRQDSRKG